MKQRVVYITLGIVALIVIGLAVYYSIDWEKYVKINESNFPDQVFREEVESFDKNEDGKLSEKECLDVKYINVNDSSIKSLQGIEYFPKLDKLDCRNCYLKELDLSENIELRNLDCAENSLKKLDLAQNIELAFIDCSENSISELVLPDSSELVTLDCNGNYLDRLDVSRYKKLDLLDCTDNELTRLDVRKNTKLTHLN